MQGAAIAYLTVVVEDMREDMEDVDYARQVSGRYGKSRANGGERGLGEHQHRYSGRLVRAAQKDCQWRAMSMEELIMEALEQYLDGHGLNSAIEDSNIRVETP